MHQPVLGAAVTVLQDYRPRAEKACWTPNVLEAPLIQRLEVAVTEPGRSRPPDSIIDLLTGFLQPTPGTDEPENAADGNAAVEPAPDVEDVISRVHVGLDAEDVVDELLRRLHSVLGDVVGEALRPDVLPVRQAL